MARPLLPPTIMETNLHFPTLHLPFAARDIINPGDRVRTKSLPSFWMFFWISVFLFLTGWGGLAYLVLNTLPYLGPRWLFFFFLMLAFTAIGLPVAYFLNRRFPSDPPSDSSVVLREAMWVGVYVCTLVWLQLGRMLNPGLGAILAAGFLLVELLLRLRERAVWSPPKSAEDSAASQDDKDGEEEDEFDND